MKILVLSDSHSSRNFMRLCVDKIRPDTIVHLGDYFEDGEVIHEEYPEIEFFQVPGNCDRYRCPPSASEILIMPVCGVNLYMTHGHKHSVKSYLGSLLRDARKVKAGLVLYGHTHIPDCRKEGALWVLNPGASGSWGGSAGIIEVEGGKILSCRHYVYGDQEELK